MTVKHTHTSSDGDFEFHFDEDTRKFMIALPPVEAMQLFCITNHVAGGMIDESVAEHMSEGHAEFAATLREGIIAVIGPVSKDDTGMNVFDGYPVLPVVGSAEYNEQQDDEEEGDDSLKGLPRNIRERMKEEGLTRDNLLGLRLNPKDGTVSLSMSIKQAGQLSDVTEMYEGDAHSGMMRGLTQVLRDAVEQFEAHGGKVEAEEQQDEEGDEGDEDMWRLLRELLNPSDDDIKD